MVFHVKGQWHMCRSGLYQHQRGSISAVYVNAWLAVQDVISPVLEFVAAKSIKDL